MAKGQAMNDLPGGTEDRARRADGCARSGADRDVERRVLFIQGALGSTCWVRYPKMVNEDAERARVTGAGQAGTTTA